MFLMYALVVVALATQAILGLPHTITELEKREKPVPCYPISKYSVEWFVNNACKRPKPGSCSFYTKGLSEKARRLAKKNSFATTIWQMWPEGLYVKRQIISNPMRCIMQNKDEQQTYFKHMSEAMAVQCDLQATVLTKDISDIPTNGIWHNVEFPALKQSNNRVAYSPYGGLVNKVEIFSEIQQKAEALWTRSEGDVDAVDLALRPIPLRWTNSTTTGWNSTTVGRPLDGAVINSAGVVGVGIG